MHALERKDVRELEIVLPSSALENTFLVSDGTSSDGFDSMQGC
jgi:hypothetical protein